MVLPLPAPAPAPAKPCPAATAAATPMETETMRELLTASTEMPVCVRTRVVEPALVSLVPSM